MPKKPKPPSEKERFELMLSEEVYFDPNIVKNTINDIRKRIKGNYVILQPQMHLLMESHDKLLHSHLRLFELLAFKLRARRTEIQEFLASKKPGKAKKEGKVLDAEPEP